MSRENSRNNEITMADLIKTVAAFGALFAIGAAYIWIGHLYFIYAYKKTPVRDVAVSGNHILPVHTIAATVPKNTPLVDLNVKEIYSRLIKNPWIMEAYIAKLYPDTIYIKVVEKKPAGIVQLGKVLYVVDNSGKVIDRFSEKLNMNPNRLPHILVDNRALFLNSQLISSIIAMYEKLDKFDKINYIEAISDSYQLVHFAHGLNVGINSLECPEIAFRHLEKEWTRLMKIRHRLDHVNICFRNKFVLKWKKEREGGRVGK